MLCTAQSSLAEALLAFDDTGGGPCALEGAGAWPPHCGSGRSRVGARQARTRRRRPCC